MNKKLLFNLFFTGCLMGINANGSTLFDLKKLAKKPTELQVAVKKLSKYRKGQLIFSAKSAKINLEKTIQFYEKEDQSCPITRLANLANPRRGIKQKKYLETLKKNLENITIVHLALSLQEDTPVVIIETTAESKTNLKLNLRDKNESPMLPLFSEESFSVSDNNFQTWSEKRDRGEAPKEYENVPARYTQSEKETTRRTQKVDESIKLIKEICTSEISCERELPDFDIDSDFETYPNSPIFF